MSFDLANAKCSWCEQLPCVSAILEPDGTFIAAGCKEHHSKIVLMGIEDQIRRQGLL